MNNIVMNDQPVERTTVALRISPVERQNIVTGIRDIINQVDRCYWLLSPPAVVTHIACQFLPPRIAIALSWNTDETMKLWSEALAQCRLS
jgi:hypothetical protein